eukprot:6820980-Karenia_brevis.AAC.1
MSRHWAPSRNMRGHSSDCSHAHFPEPHRGDDSPGMQLPTLSVGAPWMKKYPSRDSAPLRHSFRKLQ